MKFGNWKFNATRNTDHTTRHNTLRTSRGGTRTPPAPLRSRGSRRGRWRWSKASEATGKSRGGRAESGSRGQGRSGRGGGEVESVNPPAESVNPPGAGYAKVRSRDQSTGKEVRPTGPLGPAWPGRVQVGRG